MEQGMPGVPLRDHIAFRQMSCVKDTVLAIREGVICVGYEKVDRLLTTG